jgi:N-methylhydantoinase A/oxoprolinase/acetone carboxylase beta subunit
LGGGEATVTDAACCLGIFDPANFLGGRRSLDVKAARRVVEEKVAGPLGLDLATAAALILERTAVQIADAVASRLKSRSLDPTGCTLFATGGGGGILGYAIGRHLGMAAVYAFPVSPVFSAFGQSQLDVMHTYEMLPGDADVAEAMARLRRAAHLDMRGEGFDAGDVVFRWQAEVVDGDNIAVHDLDTDEARVVEAIRAHGHALRLVRMTASAPGRAAALPTVDAAGEKAARQKPRPIPWPGREEPTCVFEWMALPQGFEIDGPAVLETTKTTLVVPPDALGVIGALGELKMVSQATAEDRAGCVRRHDEAAERCS